MVFTSFCLCIGDYGKLGHGNSSTQKYPKLIYGLIGIVSDYFFSKQGPVVQSIVSLTSSLRGHFVKCFTTL